MGTGDPAHMELVLDKPVLRTKQNPCLGDFFHPIGNRESCAGPEAVCWNRVRPSLLWSRRCLFNWWWGTNSRGTALGPSSSIHTLRYSGIGLSLLWIWLSGLALVSDNTGALTEALPLSVVFITHYHHFVSHLLPPQTREASKEGSSGSWRHHLVSLDKAG